MYTQVRALILTPSVRPSSKGQYKRISGDFKKKFQERISDDFNVAQAMAVVQELLKSDLENQDKLATILDFDRVLGLNLAKVIKEKIKIPKEIQDLVDQREKARKDKDFKKADELRALSESKGYIIEDSSKGPVIRQV